MKKSILTLLLLFGIVAVTNAQITATVARTDRVADPGTRLSSYVLSFTSVNGATYAADIDVTDKKDLVVQVYSGTTVSGSINGATATPIWIEASPMNPGSSVASTYTKFASTTITPISSRTTLPLSPTVAGATTSIQITTETQTMTSYGLYRMDVSAFGKIRVHSGTPDQGTGITVVVTTK